MSIDESLTAAATEEDDYAWMRQRLERALARSCPPWLADQKEDLVQTALIKVMEIRRRSEGERTFSSSYLWRTAYSALIDEIRRHRRRGEVPLDDGESESPLPDPEPGPERVGASRQIGRALDSCLAQLVRPRQLAVTLHLQGHRVREAAELLGWTAKRVENLTYRGLADLRSCLQRKGFSP